MGSILSFLKDDSLSDPKKSDLKKSGQTTGQTTVSSSIELTNQTIDKKPSPSAPLSALPSGLKSDPKPDTDLKFTDDYGTPYFISFLSTIYCRLAYMNSRDFLNVYTQVFGKIIKDELMQDMNNAVLEKGIKVLIDDKDMFGLTDPNTKKYDIDIKEFEHPDKSSTLGFKFLPLSAKINKVLGDQRKSPTDPNCEINDGKAPIADKNLVFVNITNSNYGEIYVIGDTRMPNIVYVSFRGTASLKSVGSYLRGSSLTPTTISEKGDIKIKVLQGIYKILNENMNVIMNAIEYVATKINPESIKNINPKSIKIITTGHSLGGALATLFAFKYIYFPKYRKDRNWLDPNIGCFTLGSPRVLDKNTAKVFCSLVEQNSSSFDSWPTIQTLLSDFKKETPDHGWITYLRITTYNDPITALPPSSKLITYSHPCSDDGDNFRSKISQDCLLLVQEPFSKRCLTKKKLVHTNKYDEPMNCVRKKRALSLKASETGKFFANRMVYHTQYLGISFAGGLSVSGFMQTTLVGRLKSVIGLETKKGDTVTRLIFYPAVNNDNTNVNIFFYDLSLYRDRESNDQAIADELKSVDGTKEIEMTELPTVPTVPIVQTGGITSLPEDIKITMPIFNAMVEYIKNPKPTINNPPVYEQMNMNNSIKFDIINTDLIPTDYSQVTGGKTKRRNRKARVNKRNTKRIRIPRAIKLHKK